MSTTQLIDTVMINPTVSLQPSYRDTGLTASYTFEPLSNLVYTRDQQVTTCKWVTVCISVVVGLAQGVLARCACVFPLLTQKHSRASA